MVARLKRGGGGAVDSWHDCIEKGGDCKGRREEEKKEGKNVILY